MSYYVRVSVTCVLLIMHNYHAIYVLIYYSGIRVKNLNFGLKNILCVLCRVLIFNDHLYYIIQFICSALCPTSAFDQHL